MPSLCWWFAIIQIILQNNNAETRFCSGSSNPQCSCLINSDPCELRCVGKDKCKGSDVQLSCSANQPCQVWCDSASEENACEDTTIDGSLSTTLTVYCHDKQSCLNANINCGRGDCKIICISSDSTGSNCKNLKLNCGPSSCIIQCENGPNICNNVRVTTLLTTKSFECQSPGINNPACTYINNNNPPFRRATLTPTLNTVFPTYNPSISPSKTPTINPTIPTIYSTIRPTNNPSVKPTIDPSPNPTPNPTFNPINTVTVTVSNTNKLTANPTNNPIIIDIPILVSDPTLNPSINPSLNPTIAPLIPTKPNYHVIGELTDTPTKERENIYAEQTVEKKDIMDMLFVNWIYVAMGSGGILCCFLLICCKRCRGRKRVAPPAKYNPPRNYNKKRKGEGRFRHPKENFVHVKSSSRATNISLDECIPPQPNEFIASAPITYSLSMEDMKEGLELNQADDALPDTRGRMNTNDAPNSHGSVDESTSNDMENKQLIDQGKGNNDVELMDDISYRV